jgi:hypothetical protein
VGEGNEVERVGFLEEETQRLRDLSDKAEGGDKAARAELRRVVARSSPAQIVELCDVARRAEKMLVKTIATGEPLTEEALLARLGHMRTEIAGENPSPLEVLLSERVVSGWLLVEVLEALLSAQYRRNGGADGETVRRASPSYVLQMSRILESATRRNMQAIQTLARVRKLQATTPGVQFNTQINLR